MLRNIVLGVAILSVSAVLFGCSRSKGNQTTVTSQPQAIQTVQTVAPSPSPQSSSATPSPSPTVASREPEKQPSVQATADTPIATDKENCYDSDALKRIRLRMGTTADTRRDFAVKKTEGLDRLVGADVIWLTTGGTDNQYLLFSSSPENAYILGQVSKAIWQPASQDNLCALGFAEVQFITKNADFQQELLKKYTTSASEFTRRTAERWTVPMQ